MKDSLARLTQRQHNLELQLKAVKSVLKGSTARRDLSLLLLVKLEPTMTKNKKVVKMTAHLALQAHSINLLEELSVSNAKVHL
jgi:hypothetical protein